MKLGLIQTKQNILYDFANPHTFSAEERLRLSEEMVEQNIRLINEAAALGADLILTSEAINFTGTPVDRETFDIIPEYDEGGGVIKRLRDISARTGAAKRSTTTTCATALPDRLPNTLWRWKKPSTSI